MAALGLDHTTGAIWIFVFGAVALHTSRLDEGVDLLFKINFLLSRYAEDRKTKAEESGNQSGFLHMLDVVSTNTDKV